MPPVERKLSWSSGFSGVRVAHFFVFYVVFCISLFVRSSFGHMVCPSIYGFGLALRYLHTFLPLITDRNNQVRVNTNEQNVCLELTKEITIIARDKL